MKRAKRQPRRAVMLMVCRVRVRWAVRVLAAHDGEPYVVMRTVVDGMGLDWKSQHTKLVDKFASTVVMITTVGEVLRMTRLEIRA